MQFDSHDESWKPAHDHDVRLRSPWALALALAIMALGAAALMAAPVGQQRPQAAVAGVLP
jgi:hypothetical protein